MPRVSSELLALVLLATRLARQMQPHLDGPLTSATGLSLTGWLVLTAVRDTTAYGSRIAEHQRLSAPTVTRHVQRLIQQGLVRRSTDATDLRWSRLRVTTQGWALCREADLEVEGALQRMFHALPQEALRAALAALDGLERGDGRL